MAWAVTSTGTITSQSDFYTISDTIPHHSLNNVILRQQNSFFFFFFFWTNFYSTNATENKQKTYKLENITLPQHPPPGQNLVVKNAGAL